MRNLLLLLIALAVASGATMRVFAQTVAVPPGSSVRVASPVYTGEATVIEVTNDSLRLVVEGLAAPVSLPLSGIARLEKQRSARVGERALRGAKWGAIVGGGFGLLGMAMSERGPGDPPLAIWPIYGAGLFGMFGALIGMPIPQKRWDDIPISRQVEFAIAPGFQGVSIAVRF